MLCPFVGAHAHHPVSRLEVPLQEQGGPAVAASQVSRAAPSFQARSVDFDPMSSSCKTATAVTGHAMTSIITRTAEYSTYLPIQVQQGNDKTKQGEDKARQSQGKAKTKQRQDKTRQGKAGARILYSHCRHRSLGLSLTRNRVAQSPCQVPTSYHIHSTCRCCGLFYGLLLAACGLHCKRPGPVPNQSRLPALLAPK
ncbi:hypothetical protein GGI42DRAFT_117419 [Trichoderma sp. SZMC 28013]